MYERVFIAALDVHDDDSVNVSSDSVHRRLVGSPDVRMLTETFLTSPSSLLSLPSVQWALEALLLKFNNTGLRVSRLIGMHCEYHGRWDEAAEHYEAVLSADPTHIGAWKRLIAVAKARGKVDDAIARLVRYTKTFAADEAGWLELCDLYVQQQQVELAQFCMEELILLAPEHCLYHTRYAELLYADGRYDLARQYFAQAVELKPNNNLRALYGIIMVTPTTACTRLRPSRPYPHGTAADRPQTLLCALLQCIRLRPGGGHAALYAWSVEKVLNHYRQYAPAILSVVQQSLELALPPGGSAPALTSSSAASATSSASTTPSSAAIRPAITASATTTPASITGPSEPSPASASSSISSTKSTAASSAPASAASVDGKKSTLTTVGVRVTDGQTGAVLQSGEEENNDVQRLASVLGSTGLRERTPASAD